MVAEMDLRKLDALVAEHVMGERVIETDDCNGDDNLWLDRHDDLELPHYSTDIADAWELVEKILTDDFQVKFVNYDDNRKWMAGWDGWNFTYGATAPLAICLAALKAKAIDISEWDR